MYAIRSYYAYTIVRQKRNFLIFKGDNLIAECTRVTHELALILEEIFGFSVYLPDKTQKKHVLAPPVFTYLPYYIDQDSGWGTEPYESFAALDQFKKPDRIKSLYYHLGVYNKHSVDIMATIDHNKAEIERLQGIIDRAEITLEQIMPEVQGLVPAVDVLELEKMLKPSKEKIAKIVSELTTARERIQKLQSDLLQHSKHLASMTAHTHKESTDDGKTLNICPKCGYEYDAEFNARVREIYNVENADYLVQQIRYIIASLEKSLVTEETRYVELMEQLRASEATLSKTHDQYDVYVKHRGLMTTITRMHQSIGRITSYNVCYTKLLRKVGVGL